MTSAPAAHPDPARLRRCGPPRSPGLRGARCGPAGLPEEEVGRQGRSYFKGATRALRRCRDLIARGTLPPGTDCTVDAAAAAKLARAESQLIKGLNKRCSNATLDGLVFGDACYGARPSRTRPPARPTCTSSRRRSSSARCSTRRGPVTGAARNCQKNAALQATNFAFKLDLIRACKDDVARGKLPADTDCDAQTSSRRQPARDDRRQDRRLLPRCRGHGSAVQAPCTGVTTSNHLVGCSSAATTTASTRLVVTEYGRGHGGVANVKLVTDAPTECVKGPLARCATARLPARQRQGARVVVQSIQRNILNVGQYGGQIIDADLVRAG
ncbi:MAG: hypothetical protein U1F09_16350 [Steroidobacteraceae bacterium]